MEPLERKPDGIAHAANDAFASLMHDDPKAVAPILFGLTADRVIVPHSLDSYGFGQAVVEIASFEQSPNLPAGRRCRSRL